jgi:large conductance mechanosensitive channel
MVDRRRFGPCQTDKRDQIAMLKGFRNFLMRGDVIVAAVGLSVALAFSNLVKVFTDDIINPLIAPAQGRGKRPWAGLAAGQRR